MATISPQAVSLLVELGVKLVEAHLGKPIEAISNGDLIAAVNNIKVRSADDLIEQGEAEVAGATAPAAPEPTGEQHED